MVNNEEYELPEPPKPPEKPRCRIVKVDIGVSPIVLAVAIMSPAISLFIIAVLKLLKKSGIL